MTYTVEFYRDRDRQHRWRIKHRNGRIIADSGEGYRRRGDALRALTRLMDAPAEAFRIAMSPAMTSSEAKVALAKRRAR